jgi:zinc transport system substrate-binding protein
MRKMNKQKTGRRWLVAVVVIGLVLGGVVMGMLARGKGGMSWGGRGGDGEKPIVVATYPLEFFARRIAGEAQPVINIVPPGVDPHDFEPTTTNLIELENALLVIVGGSGVESWYERTAAELAAQEAPVLELNQYLALADDAHFWLDPVLASEAGALITERLVAVNPEQAATYQQNWQVLKTDLNDLQDAYAAGLAMDKCEQEPRLIVTPHLAFSHVASRYQLVDKPLMLDHDWEPAAGYLAELVDQVKEAGVSGVFADPNEPTELAETIAAGAGVKVYPLYTIEVLSDEQKARGDDYLTLMRENLVSLQSVLRCN